MGAQREPCDHAPAASTAALQRPVEIRVGAGVGDPYLPIRGDDLGLEETRRGRAESLREAAEAAALHESGDPDVPAAVAVHVAARLGHESVVQNNPHVA